jgi:glycosyl transferase family 25
MKAYVISMTNATTRRAHISAEFDRQNISFEFFDAIDSTSYMECLNNIPFELNLSQLSIPEKGCFLSHLSLWQRLITQNLAHIAIFEDDIHLGKNANEVVNQFQWENLSFDIMKLEAFSSRVRYASRGALHIHANRSAYLLYEKHMGTAGYIISSQGVESLISLIKSYKGQPLPPIDHLMFDLFLCTPKATILQLNPALCIQDDIKNKGDSTLHSMIGRNRHASNTCKKSSFQAKLIRELSRPFIQLYNFIIVNKARFKKPVDFE